MTLLAVVTLILFFQTNVAEGFPIWLLGSLAYVVTQHFGERLHRASNALRYGAVAGGLVAFLAALVWTHIRYTSWLIDGLILGVAFGLLLVAVIVFNVGIPKLFRPLAVYGAEASFSLYLIHFPIMLFSASLVFGGQAFEAGWLTLALAIGMTAFLVGVGWVFSRLTEKHPARARKRLSGLLLRPPAPRAKPDGAGA